MIQPRENILKMHGYTPGEQPKDVSKWIKLNTNENPYPPSPQCEAVLRMISLDSLRRYPNPTADELRDVIGRLFRFEREEILVGNGSDDVLNLVMRAYAGERSEVAVLTPSYSLYPSLAEIQGVNVRYIELNNDFSLPSNHELLFKDVSAVFIPSPNAPTGVAFPLDMLRSICKKVNAIVVIDEAYADFAKENALNLVRECDNVIISRTFSKSYSLAGLRVGFAISCADVIAQLMKVKDSYNVGFLPQVLAQTALEDQEYFQSTVKKVIAQRERAIERLTSLGFVVTPSQANFIFVKPKDEDGLRCYEYLKSHRILVRYFAYENTKKYVRITIGTPIEMDELFQVLANYPDA